MHRNRILQTSQTELRTQRNRILPIVGGDSSAFGFDFTSTTETILKQQFTFTRSGTNATYLAATGKITTAGADVPRFEYSEAGQPLGILLEGPGKNSILYSEDQSNAVWIEYANSGTSDKGNKSTTSAPDGSTNGNKLTITGTGDNGIYQKIPTALKVVNKRLTISVWVWTESGTGTVRLNYFNGGSSSVGTNESITTKPRRITRTITISGNVALDQNVTISNSGGAVTFVWWGYQMEDAWQPSSYIQTTSGEVSRNGDILTMSGTNFTNWFKQNEGTALMSFDYKNQGDPASSIYPRVIAFAPSSNPGNNPQTTAGYSVGDSKFFVNARQATVQITDTFTSKSYVQGTNIALGFSYSNLSGKTILCVNGDVPTTTTNSNTYGTAGIGQLSFTRDISSGVMHLKFFKFWRDAKPAAELQQIVNNANFGYSPAFSTVYVTGDMGSLLNYNSILEGVTYASRKGGSVPDDWATADKVIVAEDFNFGIRAIMTKGNPAFIADNFGYNVDDSYLETSVGMQSASTGSEITLGMYSLIPTGLAGRIELYKWEDKRTIVSAEFKT
jgi:hypothetical protein